MYVCIYIYIYILFKIFNIDLNYGGILKKKMRLDLDFKKSDEFPLSFKHTELGVGLKTVCNSEKGGKRENKLC